MADCFTDIIGIRSACATAVSSSGMFIEDIGITTKECDSYINSEYKNGLELIQDKMDFASRVLKATITNEFSSKINTASLIDSKLLGQYQDSLQMKSGISGSLGGISITLNNTQSYYDVFVNSVSLQLDYTGSVDVLVYDLISGVLLDTLAVDCVTNEISTKVINKVYSSPKRKMDLIFVYDTTGKSSNNTILYQGCGPCQAYKYNNYYLSAAPIYLESSAAKIRSSLQGGAHTFGLSVNYSIQCSIDKWICEIANLMAFPLLYKTGELIMEYALMISKRINSDVSVDAERNERKLSAYANAYNDHLASSIKKIRLPKNDRCFSCNESAIIKIILP
jgi:hypothetical protein